MTEECPPPGIVSSPQIGTSVSYSARVWDYWLDGKYNYQVDRLEGLELERGDRLSGQRG